jgi:hypothetical protein
MQLPACICGWQQLPAVYTSGLVPEALKASNTLCMACMACSLCKACVLGRWFCVGGLRLMHEAACMQGCLHGKHNAWLL